MLIHKEPIVFICEDDNEILEVVRIILSHKGYKVKFCTCGSGAFEEIKELKPDLVLMDIALPKVGGDIITTRLKQDEETRKIPVILFSALNIIEEIAKKVNADYFLRKPFDINDFTNIIHAALENSLSVPK